MTAEPAKTSEASENLRGLARSNPSSRPGPSRSWVGGRGQARVRVAAADARGRVSRRRRGQPEGTGRARRAGLHQHRGVRPAGRPGSDRVACQHGRRGAGGVRRRQGSRRRWSSRPASGRWATRPARRRSRPSPPVTAIRIVGPNCAGIINTATPPLPHARDPAPARPRRDHLAERRAGRRAARLGEARRAGHLEVRQLRQPGRRERGRSARLPGGRSGDARRLRVHRDGERRPRLHGRGRPLCGGQAGASSSRRAAASRASARRSRTPARWPAATRSTTRRCGSAARSGWDSAEEMFDLCRALTGLPRPDRHAGCDRDQLRRAEHPRGGQGRGGRAERRGARSRRSRQAGRVPPGARRAQEPDRPDRRRDRAGLSRDVEGPVCGRSEKPGFCARRSMPRWRSTSRRPISIPCPSPGGSSTRPACTGRSRSSPASCPRR